VAAGPPRFVIQRHTACRLHFDFRLEIDGELVSWAVPNGPAADPGERRLATRTENHALEYLDFEGRMPAGRYGAGPVAVWDSGVFHNLSAHPLTAALRTGELHVWLVGEKLYGGYVLTQIRTRGGDQNWVLAKLDDDRRDLASRMPGHQLAAAQSRRPGR
jgi:DNA ligase D-like protein (predicted 3'-phosphoesterase)